jgi:DNA-binding GntR family transcriptional regulator
MCEASHVGREQIFALSLHKRFPFCRVMRPDHHAVRRLPIAGHTSGMTRHEVAAAADHRFLFFEAPGARAHGVCTLLPTRLLGIPWMAALIVVHTYHASRERGSTILTWPSFLYANVRNNSRCAYVKRLQKGIVYAMDGIQSVIPLNHEAATDDKSLLSDVIRQALAEEIATGLLNPGTPLDEQQIATRFGASRTPVREALRQLAVTGMVDIRPRRGVTVAMMTAERIMDMFETTAEVETMCVRLATYRISPVERSQLQEMQDASAEWVRGGDINAYDDFNRQFHEAIYRATHNQFLVEQAIGIRARLAAFRRTQLRKGDRLIKSHDEHGQILQAMARGDGDEAARCMRAHMLNASCALTSYIQEMQLA